MIAAAPRFEMPGRVRWPACLLLVLGAHAAIVAFVLRRVELPARPETPPAILLDLAPEPASPAAAAAPPQPEAARPAEPSLAEAAPPEPVVAAPPEPATPAPPPAVEPAPAASTSPLPSRPPPGVQTARRPPPVKPPARSTPRRDPADAEAERTPPALAAPPAQTAVAAPAPAAANQAAAAASWRSLLMGRLVAARRYPDRARARGEQGVAVASFTMDRNGRVVAASLARSSGSALLDEEAVALIHRADPLPPPPADMPGATLTLSVPISFALR